MAKEKASRVRYRPVTLRRPQCKNGCGWNKFSARRHDRFHSFQLHCCVIHIDTKYSD